MEAISSARKALIIGLIRVSFHQGKVAESYPPGNTENSSVGQFFDATKGHLLPSVKAGIPSKFIACGAIRTVELQIRDSCQNDVLIGLRLPETRLDGTGVTWAGCGCGERSGSCSCTACNCSIPDDHISPRRSAFFMARSVMRDILSGVRPC